MYLYIEWTRNLTHIIDFVVTRREVVITYFHQPRENNMYLTNLKFPWSLLWPFETQRESCTPRLHRILYTENTHRHTHTFTNTHIHRPGAPYASANFAIPKLRTHSLFFPPKDMGRNVSHPYWDAFIGVSKDDTNPRPSCPWGFASMALTVV